MKTKLQKAREAKDKAWAKQVNTKRNFWKAWDKYCACVIEYNNLKRGNND